MTKQGITQRQVAELAAHIREARKNRNETLISVQRYTGINCGQLSRFEAGRFKTISKNLQKLCLYLQIDPRETVPSPTPGSRLDSFASLSLSHFRLAEDLVGLLEEIMINR